MESVTYLEGPDFSLARFHGRGRDDGAMGSLPATGRETNNPFWALMRHDNESKAVSAEIEYDQMTMLVQFGHLEPPV